MCFAPPTACTFSTSQLPKVVRMWCALYVLTWKCASCDNGVQFFISPLASWLRTRRFNKPTFRPSGATNHWKNTVTRDFPTFSRVSIFFLLALSLLLFSLLIFLFSLPLPCSAFHLSILSEVWLLIFRWCVLYIFTSKCASRHNGLHFFDILGNVLRATAACTFSTSQLPKVVRTPSVFNILTWKCASRHNRAHFFDISSAKSGPHP